LTLKNTKLREKRTIGCLCVVGVAAEQADEQASSGLPACLLSWRAVIYGCGGGRELEAGHWIYRYIIIISFCGVLR
jgi:hypothetical protein